MDNNKDYPINVFYYSTRMRQSIKSAFECFSWPKGEKITFQTRKLLPIPYKRSEMGAGF
jgi:hypothetical protein